MVEIATPILFGPILLLFRSESLRVSSKLPFCSNKIGPLVRKHVLRLPSHIDKTPEHIQEVCRGQARTNLQMHCSGAEVG